MGYLLDQMEKVAYFAEEALMEKLADKAHDKAVTKARRLKNKANAAANKAVAGSMQSGNLANAAAQLGVGVDEVADMTPRNIARTLEKRQGKGLLKAVQEAVKGGGSVADVIPHAPGAGYEDLQNMLKSREGVINSLAGARDEALAKVNSLTGKVDAVRAHGANRARNLLNDLRYKNVRLAQMSDDLANVQDAYQQVRTSNHALRRNVSQLTDDLDNFKNLGRLSGVAKWIKGNPKKALGAAILGGGGLLGGAGAAGYAMNGDDE